MTRARFRYQRRDRGDLGGVGLLGGVAQVTVWLTGCTTGRSFGPLSRRADEPPSLLLPGSVVAGVTLHVRRTGRAQLYGVIFVYNDRSVGPVREQLDRLVTLRVVEHHSRAVPDHLGPEKAHICRCFGGVEHGVGAGPGHPGHTTRRGVDRP